MRFKLSFLLLAIIFGCGTPKTTTEKAQETQENPITPAIPIKYEIYFVASRTATNPPDEITIDSNGQMVTLSQQLMQDGKWKKPKGLAILEDIDKAILDSILAEDALYTIINDDILPPCSDGADYIIKVQRKDKSLALSIKTNTCAMDENTLSGAQRPLFRRLIKQFEQMRTKYRPQFLDKGK